MDRTQINILLVEDDPIFARLLEGLLRKMSADFVLTHVPRLAEALRHLDHTSFDVVLLDLGLEDSWGIDTCISVCARAPRTPIVVLTADDSEELGVKALQEGAQDYLVKGGLDGRTLMRALRYAIERKRAQEALRENQEHYRTLLQNLPLSVYEIDANGRLVSMNQAGVRVMGLRAPIQFNGQAYLDMLPEAHRAQIAMLMAGAYAGELLEIEYSGDVEGQQHVFISTLMPVTDADGAISKLIGMTQDVTERVQVHLEAEVERDRLGAILESANDAIMMVDLNQQVVLVNQAFCTFFGVDAETVLGMAGERVLNDCWDHFDQPEEFLSVVRSLFAQPQREASGEVAVKRPAQRMLVWYSGPVRTRAATSLGRLFIFRDATREKEADLLKSEFISIVSHELRTPLTSIKGFTDLILEGDAGEISPQVQEFLEIVKTSADQLVMVTDDILETSWLESGKIKLKPEPIILGEVAQRVATSIQTLLSAKAQTLSLDLPADLPQAYADQERLVQVLINLLSNAHKYTPAGGQISVRARLVRDAQAAHLAHGDSDGAWLVVDVGDTGIGIAPEDQQHLFTRFYRVSSTETQGISGTGLGLSITKALVELHGGAIWVDSEPGHGSMFSFSLPAIVRPLELAPSQPPVPSGDRPTLLVVEPEMALARLIRYHLERSDYTVVLAASGREALALAHERHPALVVLAVQLPDMDGYSLIEHLRASPDTSGMPVIMTSPIEDAGRALRLGVAGFLSIPLDERRLIDVVEATVRQDKRSIALVVDDDPQVTQIVTALLTQRGFNAFMASDGQQGLTLARRLQPSLMLLDLWMPGMNGFQVLNVLRQHPATQSIVVIAMTDSKTPPQAIRRVLALGATDLLTKPLDMEALEQLITTRLDSMAIVAELTNIDSNDIA